MTSPVLLVTGAAGGVASLLLPGLQGRALRLLDRRAVPAIPGAEAFEGDLTDRALLDRAVAGVDAVVHLAGDPSPSATWPDLRGPNVDGFAALLEAAARHRVRRVVYASSVHAAGRWESAGRVPVDPSWAPAPCCPYGATKAFAEALAAAAAHRGHVDAVGLRLGATVAVPTRRSQLTGWLGPLDLREVVRRALAAPVRPRAVHPAVHFAVSGARRSHWNASSAAADLGYRPVQDSREHATDVEDDGTDVTTCPPGGA